MRSATGTGGAAGDGDHLQRRTEADLQTEGPRDRRRVQRPAGLAEPPGRPVALRPRLVLARDGYGWVEFAAPEACRDEDAVGRYYRRMGALVRPAYLLQGSDCHAENLSPQASIRSWWTARRCSSVACAAEARAGSLGEHHPTAVRDSVLSSALLPGSAADGRSPGTPCGICDGAGAAVTPGALGGY